MVTGRDYLNFALHIVLVLSTVFINKYVLSVLCFTYPTIYQGWQTLVGGLVLRLLIGRSSWPAVSHTPLDKTGFVSLLPSFLFFVAGIVASSKALASLTIGMFLCLHNAVPSVLYLLEVVPSVRKSVGGSSVGGDVSRVGVVAALLILITALVAVVADLDMTFSESPYFWLLVSLSCAAVQRLHGRIADARYTEADRLYFSYVFSVIVLAPASLYLEEAFDVLKFPHAARLDFTGACVLVGVLAVLLNVNSIKVQQLPYYSKVDAVSKLLTSAGSVLVFHDPTSVAVKGLVMLNLSLGLLVPGVLMPVEEAWVPAGEDAEPLV